MTKVMLLIDADNVSVDVMAQAVERLLAEHGALHVRRAYCSAESARKHQAVFQKLSIRPMVNLAAGKNSTDIALAVDALDLVIAERPEVVVIASSDSDFAPLVSRLREKGCRVCGIGQQGKTGAETEAVYDEFVQLAGKPMRASARRTARKASDGSEAAAPERPQSAPGRAPSRRTGGRSAAPAAPAAEVDSPHPGAASSRKRPRAAKAVSEAKEPSEVKAAGQLKAAKTPARRSAAKAAAPARPDAPPPPPAVAHLLQVLPALARGETVELQKAAEALRRSGELSRRSSAQKLFARFSDWFDLQPAADPRQVSLRRRVPS